MPRKPINYAKTLIYKLVCNDVDVIDLYVGSTSSFVDRKSTHKNNCNNPKNKRHNLKVYKMIRENGGWENWSMVMIEPYPCKNKLEASKKEREWLEELQASLNSQVPSRTPKEWREDNRETILEYQKKHYEANRETIRERHKKYNENNRETILERQKKYIESNHETILEYQKAYRLKNRIKLNERRRENYKKLKIQNQAESILPT